MTDTADLVKELDALFARATPGPWVPARRRGSWDWVVVQQSPGMNNEICQMFHDGTDFNEIGEANTSLICMLKTSWPAIRAALSSTQARADKLEAELAEAKRERDEARGIMPSKVWNEIFEAPAKFLTGHGKHYYANYQIVREAHQRAKEQCPLAADVIMAQAFFQAVASEREEIAWKQVLDERARAESAEASLAAANERVKELEAEVKALRNPVTWKLGETAPRDGTIILARWDGRDEWRVRYDRGWFYADGEQSECPQPVLWRHETEGKE